MRRLLLLLAVTVAALAVPGAAPAAVTVDQIANADVVADTGVTLSEADRARLQAAADEMREEGFPTKFVLVASGEGDLDATARTLRAGLAKRVGLGNIDAVFVLAPRSLGIDADVFPAERRDAFQAELEALRADPVQGTINIVRRFQARDEANLLPGEELTAKDDGGMPTLLIVLIGAVVVVGAVAFVLARRAARRGSGERADAAAEPGAEADASPVAASSDGGDTQDPPPGG